MRLPETETSSTAKLGRLPEPPTSRDAQRSWITGWLSHAGGSVVERDWRFCGVVTAPVWLLGGPNRFWYAVPGTEVHGPLAPTRYCSTTSFTRVLVASCGLRIVMIA